MWRKSSYSMGNGNCVECTVWRSSSSSGGANCVEAADWRTLSPVPANGIQVRDSKDPNGTILWFDQDTWTRFTDVLKK